MTPLPDAEFLARLREELARRLPDYLADLELLVNIESGSFTKSGADAVGGWMATRLESLGASVSRHVHESLGDTIVGTLEGHGQGPTVMLIGHTDTVFEPGYLAGRPFEVGETRILGPGVSDMKGGLLVGLYALEALRSVRAPAVRVPAGRVIYVVNADEEIGSPASTPIIEELARSADVAFVLEAARANGDIVSARKGMMHIEATIHGRAAHAGVEPEHGRSATLEAAYKTVALHGLDGRWPGVTVNVGAIEGGTRPNIVAERAVLKVDTRAPSAEFQDAAEAAIYEILESSTVADIRTDIVRSAYARPMEKSAASAELVGRAVDIAAMLGFQLHDAATGGGSDANTTAGLGVPSLDGLGPVGGSDHSPLEYIEIDSIVPRTALLAALVASVSGWDGSG
jgi:glutamate carboxypeptidase